MKKLIVSLILFIGVVFTACVDDGPEVLPLPPVLNDGSDNQVIDNILSSAHISALKTLGFTIYDGDPDLPPNINGTFLIDSSVLVTSSLRSDTTSDLINTMFEDSTLYRFTSQNTTYNTLSMQRKTKGGSESSVIKGNIMGTDTNFTAYFTYLETTKNGTEETATAKVLFVVSGVKKIGQIDNWTAAFITLEKTDPNNILPPVGSIRIFNEEDKIALQYQGDWTTFKQPINASTSDINSTISALPNEILRGGK